MAAKLVAPGHLKIKDETLGGVHPKSALNDSKTNPKRGGKKGALNDTTNQKSPQPAEDIPGPKCMCIKRKEPSEWMKIRMSYHIVHEIPLDYQLLQLEEEEHIKSIQEQQLKEVPGSPQLPFPETSIEPTDPEEDARWLEWTTAACREERKARIDRFNRALLGCDYENR